jgi:hypothetical protein
MLIWKMLNCKNDKLKIGTIVKLDMLNWWNGNVDNVIMANGKMVKCWNVQMLKW